MQPSKVLVIHGKKFSLAGANQYLQGKKCRELSKLHDVYGVTGHGFSVVTESLKQLASTCADEEVSEDQINDIRFEVVKWLNTLVENNQEKNNV